MNAGVPERRFPIGVTVRGHAARVIVQGIRDLARELGMSVGQAHKLLDRGVLPGKGPGGYDVDAARRALDARADSAAAAIEKMAPAPEAIAPPTATSSPTTYSPEEDDLEEEDDGEEAFDPLAIAEENVRRAQALAAGAQGPELPRALESVKKALEEYRRTDAGELAIAQKKGTVIAVDDARAAVGRVTRLFVSTLERLEAKLGSQIELWAFDLEFRELEPRARRQKVQEWFQAQAEVLRRLTAAEIERMVAEESS